MSAHAFAIREHCQSCDLYLNNLNKCRIIEVTDGRPPAWIRALSKALITWFGAITRDLDDDKMQAVGHSCGQRYAAARDYLLGKDDACDAWQARRRFDTPCEPQIYEVSFTIDEHGPFSEEELV